MSKKTTEERYVIYSDEEKKSIKLARTMSWIMVGIVGFLLLASIAQGSLSIWHLIPLVVAPGCNLSLDKEKKEVVISKLSWFVPAALVIGAIMFFCGIYLAGLSLVMEGETSLSRVVNILIGLIFGSIGFGLMYSSMKASKIKNFLKKQ